MRYRIIEKNKSGYFEIQEEVEKTKLTLKGFKKILVWEKMDIDYFWDNEWITNLWTNTDKPKKFLKDFNEWKNRCNKEIIIEM